jgi:glycogen synthase
MAAGVPAVATRAGGVTEFAEDGVNALLVDPDDSDAFARALDHLHSDVQFRDRLRAGGRATALNLSWFRIAPLYEELY